MRRCLYYRRIFGVIPLHKLKSTNTSLQEMVKKLEAVQTYDGFVIDTMGLGKTHTAVLFMAYYAIVVAKRRLLGQVNFCSIFCVVPSGVVLY